MKVWVVYHSHGGRLNHSPNAILERLISPSGLVRQDIGLASVFLCRSYQERPHFGTGRPSSSHAWATCDLTFPDNLGYSMTVGYSERFLSQLCSPLLLEPRCTDGAFFFPPPPPSLSQGYQGEFSSPPWLALYTPLTARSGEPPPLPPVRSSSWLAPVVTPLSPRCH